MLRLVPGLKDRHARVKRHNDRRILASIAELLDEIRGLLDDARGRSTTPDSEQHDDEITHVRKRTDI
jgi:hypothetical protein